MVDQKVKSTTQPHHKGQSKVHSSKYQRSVGRNSFHLPTASGLHPKVQMTKYFMPTFEKSFQLLSCSISTRAKSFSHDISTQLNTTNVREFNVGRCDIAFDTIQRISNIRSESHPFSAIALPERESVKITVCAGKSSARPSCARRLSRCMVLCEYSSPILGSCCDSDSRGRWNQDACPELSPGRRV